MSCETERAALDAANMAADIAEIEAKAAFEKALRDAEMSNVACGGEILVGGAAGFLGGGPIGAAIGILGGSLACAAGVSAAANSATDSSAANQKLEEFSAAAGRAFQDWYMCMERHRPSPQ